MNTQPTAIRVERRPGVTRVILNRPTEGNALNIEMAHEIVAALHEAEADSSVHLFTITGEGRFFCAGGDVKSMANHDAAERPAYLKILAGAAHEVALPVMRSRLLVTAGVNGTAAGAGLALMLNADCSLIAEEATVVAAYAGIGLSPDTGVSHLLPRTVGHQRAVDLTLNGRALSGQEAVEWGLAQEAVPAESFARRLREVEDRLLKGAVQAYGPTKALLRAEALKGYEEHLEQEVVHISELSGHPETVKLVDRFAKR